MMTMKKNEFMTKLADELKKRGVVDADDVAAEYEQHFAFKLADGYSEEEIAAKLGDPAALAVNPQFSPAAKRRMRSVALVTFAAFSVLSYVMCVLSAGSLEFWHAWSWFSA